MIRVLRGLAGAGAVLVGLGAATAGAGPLPVPGHTSLVRAPVRSYVELRFDQVVRQSHDVSCGAAALATLLKHFYGEPIGEQEIIDAAFEIGDAERIRQDGFSMLELKRVGQAHGYVAQGFKILEVENLRKLQVPVLTLVSTRGYEHFVVLKKVDGDQVLIADPAFGNRTRPLDEFAASWRHVILVFLSADRAGQDAFTADLTPKARMRDIVPLLDRTLMTVGRGAGEF